MALVLGAHYYPYILYCWDLFIHGVVPACKLKILYEATESNCAWMPMTTSLDIRVAFSASSQPCQTCTEYGFKVRGTVYEQRFSISYI